jgi:hypothetical protein
MPKGLFRLKNKWDCKSLRVCLPEVDGVFLCTQQGAFTEIHPPLVCLRFAGKKAITSIMLYYSMFFVFYL